MKPLLILPPAPQRWQSLDDLLADESPNWRDDLRRRLCEGVADATDAVSVVRDGGRMLAAAVVRRRGSIGFLSQMFTRAAHRGQGMMRATVQSLLSWFDMTGGRELLTVAPAAGAAALESLGFARHHAHTTADGNVRIAMRRIRAHSAAPSSSEEPTVRPAVDADLPWIVALLQRRPAENPAVSMDESAVAAPETALGLLSEQARGAGRVLVAADGGGVSGVGSIATDRSGTRTFAVVLPYVDEPAPLRPALVELARTLGYETVDFPFNTAQP